MGSHSVTCHPAEVTFPPLPQPKLVLVYGYIPKIVTYIIKLTGSAATRIRTHDLESQLTQPDHYTTKPPGGPVP